jgi:Ni,Fe-hydrogenase I small subunit
VSIKRRGFLKLAGAIGAGTVCRLYGRELSRLFGSAVGRSHVIWLRGVGDSGCTLSLLRGMPSGLSRALDDFRIAADFQPALPLRPSDQALVTLCQAVAGRAPLDLLIVEGSAADGSVCARTGTSPRLVPFETWMKDLAAVARQVVAVGTCAGAAVSPFVDLKRLMTVPGCPAPPAQILLTLATALGGTAPRPAAAV